MAHCCCHHHILSSRCSIPTPSTVIKLSNEIHNSATPSKSWEAGEGRSARARRCRRRACPELNVSQTMKGGKGVGSSKCSTVRGTNRHTRGGPELSAIPGDLQEIGQCWTLRDPTQEGSFSYSKSRFQHSPPAPPHTHPGWEEESS